MSLGKLLLIAGFSGLLVACQGVPADYKPDPKLKTASPAALKSRVAEVCVKAQRAKSSSPTAELQKGCGCYANAIFKAMDAAEVTFYRQNGYFADSARPKGEAALKSCRLSS